MKKTVEMFTLVCDSCQKQFIDEYNNFVAWTDFDGARENAIDSDWVEDGENHYCDNCVEINDNDDIVIKSTGEVINE